MPSLKNFKILNNSNKNISGSNNSSNVNKQGRQKKGVDVNFKFDPLTNNISDVKVQGNIDPKDAYQFYQNNKQYLPSAKQTMNALGKAGNFVGQMVAQNQGGQANQTNDQGKKEKKGIFNLFG